MSNKIGKTALISLIAEKSGLSKVDSDKFLSAFIDSIVETLKKDDDAQVVITGFGTFKKTKRAARDGVNPKTGEKIKIAASVSPSFKAGKNFKDAIA
jgi:DNA-binding protein HU-beta